MNIMAQLRVQEFFEQFVKSSTFWSGDIRVYEVKSLCDHPVYHVNLWVACSGATVGELQEVTEQLHQAMSRDGRLSQFEDFSGPGIVISQDGGLVYSIIVDWTGFKPTAGSFVPGQVVGWATEDGRAYMGGVLDSNETCTLVSVTSGSHDQKRNGRRFWLNNKHLADLSDGRGMAIPVKREWSN